MRVSIVSDLSCLGSTLTKAVAFEDCIKAIKQNAFVTSEYPVILTIESHLSQTHQKNAALVSFNVVMH